MAHLQVMDKGFSATTEKGKLKSEVAWLIERSMDHAVLDDRGGSGQYIIVVDESAFEFDKNKAKLLRRGYVQRDAAGTIGI